MRGYSVVFVEEKLAKRVADRLPEDMLLVVLPNLDSFESKRLEELRESVSRSFGVRIRWRG